MNELTHEAISLALTNDAPLTHNQRASLLSLVADDKVWQREYDKVRSELTDANGEIGRLRQELRKIYWQRQAAKARAELQNIADAKRFDRERFDDDTSFADWAQNRARHALDDAWPDKPPHDVKCECLEVGPDYCPRHTP